MNTKGDRKANITAAFGCDVVLEGTTAVPNLLLKNYSRLGMTDRETMLVIQIMFLMTSGHNRFPSYSQISEIMSTDEAEVKSDLAGLIEKGIIAITHDYCEEKDEIIPVYSLEPLFEKLSELWACKKVSVYQKMKKNLKEQQPDPPKNKNRQKTFALVCRAFEKEFARLLSPMELEQINLWLDDFDGDCELILEALKKTVMLGKHNFKYIDSILLDWHKNNLRTVAEVSNFEAGYRQRQASKGLRRKSDQSNNKKDKFRLLYLG